jgi:hypothetical protein
MKTKEEILEEVKEKHGIGTAFQHTLPVVLEAMEAYATQQVNLLNKPAVSKCEDVEREAAVCDKCNKLKMFVKKPAHCKYCGCRLYT